MYNQIDTSIENYAITTSMISYNFKGRSTNGLLKKDLGIYYLAVYCLEGTPRI
jgi:hypothetical protein